MARLELILAYAQNPDGPCDQMVLYKALMDERQYQQEREYACHAFMAELAPGPASEAERQEALAALGEIEQRLEALARLAKIVVGRKP